MWILPHSCGSIMIWHVTHDARLESPKKMPWNRTLQKQTLEKRDQAKQNGSLYWRAKIGHLAQQKTDDSNVLLSPKKSAPALWKTSMGIRSHNLIVMMNVFEVQKSWTKVTHVLHPSLARCFPSRRRRNLPKAWMPLISRVGKARIRNSAPASIGEVGVST